MAKRKSNSGKEKSARRGSDKAARVYSNTSQALPEDFEPSNIRVEVLQDKSREKPIVISYNWDEVYKGS